MCVLKCLEASQTSLKSVLNDIEDPDFCINSVEDVKNLLKSEILNYEQAIELEKGE